PGELEESGERLGQEIRTGMREAVEFRIQRCIAQPERAREIDDPDARIEERGRELQRSFGRSREEHCGALARQLGAALLRRVLQLPGRSREAGAPRGALASPLV